MLGVRLLLGVPLFFAMVAVIYFDTKLGTGWGLAAIQAIFCAWAVGEFYRLVRVLGHKPLTLYGIISCAALYIIQEISAVYPPLAGAPGYDWMFFAIFVVVAFLIQLFFRGSKGALVNVSATVFGVVYFWGLLSFMGRMRHLELLHGWEYDGMEFVIVFFCGSKVCDIFGLLVGKRFGYHKLWPSISPNKSWEGFIGGILASVGFIALVMITNPASALASVGFLKVLPLGIVLACLGLIGDLVESSFKREAQLKDTGDSLPGYGGMMDLLDSLVLNAPVMYIYLIYICGAKPAVI